MRNCGWRGTDLFGEPWESSFDGYDDDDDKKRNIKKVKLCTHT